MSLTRDQYESAFMRAVGYFTLLVGAATAVEIFLLTCTAAGYEGIWPTLGLGLFAAVVGSFVAMILGGIGSSIVTLVLGIGLTAITVRLLRNVEDWRVHFRAFFVIGSLAAVVAAVVYARFAFAGQSPDEIWQQWVQVLDLAIIVLIAGASTSLAWLSVWRHPERYVADTEEVAA